MTDVFFCVGGLSSWVHIADRLENDHGCTISYWLSGASEPNRFTEKSPECRWHYLHDANRGVFPEFRANRTTLDREVIRRYREYESTAVRLMDRLDAGYTFSYSERKRHYFNLVSFYDGLIRSTAPSFVVFQSSPHFVASYVLYSTAREHDVETYIFTPNRLPGVGYVREDVDLPAAELVAEYERLQDETREVTLSPEREEYLQALCASPNDAEHESYGQDAFVRTPSKILKTTARIPLELLPFGSSENRLRSKSHYLKKRHTPIEHSVLSRFEYRLYDIRSTLHLRRLRLAYRELSDEPDVDRAFVYVPLHYQPERTTLPKGNVYNDQLLMIEMLQQVVPDEWLIYVKEHPKQLIKQDSHQGRSVDLYRDAVDLPSVELVDVNYPSIELVDESMAVATVTGTAGWEGVARGTPALVFGNAWYAPCRGVWQIQTMDDLEEAVKAVRSDPDLKVGDIRRFVKAVENVGFEGYITRARGEAGPDISPETNRRNKLSYLVEIARTDGHL